MKNVIILLIIMSVVYSDVKGQSCPLQANEVYQPGVYLNGMIDSQSLAYSTTPDFKTSFYNYRTHLVTNYSTVQKFGRIGNAASDMESLRLRVFEPVNNNLNNPVILLSPLSGFSSSNVYGFVTDYIASFFAKRGFVVIVYQSRKFVVRGFETDSTSELSDFITNPHYTSDTAVINDFKEKVVSNTDPNSSYTFFDLLESLSKAANGQQLVFDAYMEMIYKTSYDTKKLMNLVKQNKSLFSMNPQSIVLMGGSAAAVQAVHAGLLDQPEQLEQYLDTLVLPYSGSSYPNPGSLSQDFQFESDISGAPKAKAIVNFWGFVASLDMINPNSPDIFSVHGTWDDVFSFQQTFQDDMQLYFGYGAEGIHHRANQAGIHSDIYTVCRGKHALYPKMQTACKFTSEKEKDLFIDILGKVNYFLYEQIKLTEQNEVFIISSPAHYSTILPNQTLVPPANVTYSNPNFHCPSVYPDHFATQYYPQATVTPPNQSPQQISKPKHPIAGVIIHPNPTSGSFQIEIDLREDAELEISLVNSSGKFMGILQQSYHVEKGTEMIPIEIKGLQSGIYFVRIQTTNGSIETVKLMLD
ncbi:MAG: T9SS type A sorting domain-containing protein [Chitinophagales bacterium]|nr:T9SS type A sorting domain-containing protein [Chitinophagales bacterium]